MKRRHTFALTTLSFVVAGGFAWSVLGTLTEQRRLAAVARVEIPPILEHHRELARQLRETPVEEETPSVEGDCPDELARVRAYAALLEEARVFFGNDLWVTFKEKQMALLFPPMFMPVDTASTEENLIALDRQVVRAGASLIQRLHELLPCGGPVIIVDLETSLVKLRQLDEYRITLLNLPFLLAADARVSVRQSDLPRAVRDVALLFHGADVMAGIPLPTGLELHGEWVRIAEQALYSISTWDSLTLTQYDTLLAAVEATRAVPDMGTTLSSQLALLLHYRKSWRRRTLSEWVQDRGLYWGTRNYLWVSPLCAPLSNRDQEGVVNLYTNVIEALRLPRDQKFNRMSEIMSEADDLSVLYHSTKYSASSIYALYFRNDAALALLERVKTGLLIERYQRERGRFPDSLDELANERGGQSLGERTRTMRLVYVPFDTWFALFEGGMAFEDGSALFFWLWRRREMTPGQMEQAAAAIPHRSPG